MSGYDIFKKSLLRLSYNDYENNLSVKALEFLNQILIDLKLSPLQSLSRTVDFSPEIIEAITLGLSMFLSLIEGDSEKNRIYTSLYNSKRASILSNTTFVSDVLPKIENGGE